MDDYLRDGHPAVALSIEATDNNLGKVVTYML